MIEAVEAVAAPTRLRALSQPRNAPNLQDSARQAWPPGSRGNFQRDHESQEGGMRPKAEVPNQSEESKQYTLVRLARGFPFQPTNREGGTTCVHGRRVARHRLCGP